MTKTVAIADSQVMGRLPVLVTVTILAATGLTQFADGLGSEALVVWGGDALNIAWPICAIIAAVLVWTARFWPDPTDAAVWEIGGIVLMDLCIAVYVIAVLSISGLEGGIFIPLGLIIAIIINCLGRAIMLWRRRVWVHWVTRRVGPK